MGQSHLPEGPALFIAHRDELPSQAIDILKRHADWMDLSEQIQSECLIDVAQTFV
jgi:hypothetical protein